MSGPTAPREAVRLLTLDEESRLFLRLRATLVWETVRSMVVGSRLRLSLSFADRFRLGSVVSRCRYGG